MEQIEKRALEKCDCKVQLEHIKNFVLYFEKDQEAVNKYLEVNENEGIQCTSCNKYIKTSNDSRTKYLWIILHLAFTHWPIRYYMYQERFLTILGYKKEEEKREEGVVYLMKS